MPLQPAWQIIKASNMPISQWAGGETRQLAIDPPQASVVAQDFDWRFSSATVLQDSQFTAFPNHQRLLGLRHGAGFLLQVDAQQQQINSQQQVLRFAGRAGSSAQLTSGAVVDINLMFVARLQAQLWSQPLTTCYLDWPRPLLVGSTLLIYADQSPIEVQLQSDMPPLLLAKGDVLQLTGVMADCALRAPTGACSAVLAWLAPFPVA